MDPGAAASAHHRLPGSKHISLSMGTTSLIVLREISGAPPTALNELQRWLEPHVGLVTGVWISIWLLTALVLLVQLAREYKKFRTQRRDVDRRDT